MRYMRYGEDALLYTNIDAIVHRLYVYPDLPNETPYGSSLTKLAKCRLH